MPYLEYLFCKHCGDYARLDIDPGATIEAYRKEGRNKVALNQATIIWDYLVYFCSICGRKYEYTYRDVEKMVREYFSALSDEFKEYIDGVVEKSEGKKENVSILSEESQVNKFDNKHNQVAERVRGLYTAKN